MLKFVKPTIDGLLENWPDWWPPKDHFVNPHAASAEQYEQLRKLIDGRAGETGIEEFLSNNPEVLALTLRIFSTGHHASWLYPKQQIRPSSEHVSGLIPDYIAAGANSDGVLWFLLELKGADTRAFRTHRKRVYFTNEAQEGICQLIDYMDYSSRSQAYLRDELKMKGFREPRGILMIGSGHEADDERVRNFKAAWNRLNEKVQIRSYSSLTRIVADKVRQDASPDLLITWCDGSRNG